VELGTHNYPGPLSQALVLEFLYSGSGPVCTRLSLIRTSFHHNLFLRLSASGHRVPLKTEPRVGSREIWGGGRWHQEVSEWGEWNRCWLKKTHNLKVESYAFFFFFFGRQNWGLKPGHSILDCSERQLSRCREEPGYIGGFAIKTRQLELQKLSRNLIKENQVSRVKEFS